MKKAIKHKINMNYNTLLIIFFVILTGLETVSIQIDMPVSIIASIMFIHLIVVTIALIYTKSKL